MPSTNLSFWDIIKFLMFGVIIFAMVGCASLTSNNYKSRIRAVNKLTDQEQLYQIAIQDVDFFVKDAAMKRLTQELLVRLTFEAPDNGIRLRAIGYIFDQPGLLNVSQFNDNWGVRQGAFRKLNTTSLEKILGEAKDPAVILAAKIRLGKITWTEAFSGRNNTAGGLGDVIGAAALVDTPKPTSADVVAACHAYIRRGDASRIPELRDLLLRYGDKTLAEDYLNCGKEELADAAREWGRNHGYNVKSGDGSHRVKWGGN